MHIVRIRLPRNDCERVNASIGAGPGVNATDNSDNTLANTVNRDDNDNETVNGREANETAALTRQQPFRGGKGGVCVDGRDSDPDVEVEI